MKRYIFPWDPDPYEVKPDPAEDYSVPAFLADYLHERLSIGARYQTLAYTER